MKKADRKAELLKRLQAEIDRRTQVEKEAVRLISSGECEKACDLLNTLDDGIVKEIENELDQLDADQGRKDYGCEIELSEEITEEEMEALQEAKKMKTAWCIEQDPEKKVIKIRPGSNGCISLNRAHDARFFIEILEKAIQETFAKGGGRVKRFAESKAARFLYNHFLFYILKAIPRLQYSEYGTPQTGEKWIAIWFSWFGHVFWCKHYLLDPKDRNF